jgi:hypothetical protein
MPRMPEMQRCGYQHSERKRVEEKPSHFGKRDEENRNRA